MPQLPPLSPPCPHGQTFIGQFCLHPGWVFLACLILPRNAIIDILRKACFLISWWLSIQLGSDSQESLGRAHHVVQIDFKLKNLSCPPTSSSLLRLLGKKWVGFSLFVCLFVGCCFLSLQNPGREAQPDFSTAHFSDPSHQKAASKGSSPVWQWAWLTAWFRTNLRVSVCSPHYC